MKINFNVHSPNKNRFLTLKNQNYQKVSFGQDYLDIYSSKKEEIKNDFFEIIMPEAKVELDRAEKEAYEASSLYCDMLNIGTKTLIKGNDKLAILSTRKNGLKNEKVLKVFEGKHIAREMSILPNKHYRIKKYNNDGTYDLYEYNYSNNKAKCAKGVKEVDSYYKYSYEAEKIYSFENRHLTKYEEGYRYTRNEENKKQLSVQKCFEKLYDKEQKYSYTEGALYSYNPITKTPKLQEHTAFIKF